MWHNHILDAPRLFYYVSQIQIQMTEAVDTNPIQQATYAAVKIGSVQSTKKDKPSNM
jgi:hypothetical protein